MTGKIKWVRNYDALRNMALYVFEMEYRPIGFTVTQEIINENIESALDFKSAKD